MSRPALLALHGFAGAGADFADLAGLLPEWAWCCPELPGHGPAPAGAPELAWPAAALEEAAGEAAVRRWAAALAARHGPNRPVLLGYSLGGRLALHAAVLHPGAWRALVLVGASPGIADPAARRQRRSHDEAWAQRLLREGLPGFLEAWEAQPILQPVTPFPAAWAEARRSRRRQLDPAGLAGSLRTFGQGSLPCLTGALSQLDLPVLLVAGAHDAGYVAHAAAMANRLPQATVATIPATGHAALFEAPTAFASLLQQFLDQPPA